MTSEIHAQAIDGEEGTGARPQKRVLIEASKLADEKMDGIKRYVVELLRAFARMKLDDEVELYVMVLDRAHRHLLGREEGRVGVRCQETRRRQQARQSHLPGCSFCRSRWRPVWG